MEGRISRLAGKLCEIVEKQPHLPRFGVAVVIALHLLEAEESAVLFRARSYTTGCQSMLKLIPLNI